MNSSQHNIYRNLSIITLDSPISLQIGDLRGMSNMAELQDFSDFQGFFDTDWELHVLVMFSLVFSQRV